MIDYLEKTKAGFRAKLPVNEHGERYCLKCGQVCDWCCEACSRREAEATAHKERGQRRLCNLGKVIRDGRMPSWSYADFANMKFRQLADWRVLELVEAWEPTKGGLLISAKTGYGKTSCVSARYRLHIQECRREIEADRWIEPWPLLFVTAPELVAERRGHPLGQGDGPLLARAKRAPVLVLDDLGNEGPCDQLMFELLDDRYRSERLVTVVTTGLTRDEFCQRYDLKVWRRLAERGEVLEAHKPAIRAIRGAK